jgi:release factor glutamine methyltransferase
MNAELLLMFTLSCNRAYLFAHPERTLTPEETTRYSEALAHRARGVPAQYITGHQEFWGLDLIVGPAVLIPRPETEHVVETVLELVKRLDHRGHEVSPERSSIESQRAGVARAEKNARVPDDATVGDEDFAHDDATDRENSSMRGIVHTSAEQDAYRPADIRIVDVGTGSGAIALALAKELSSAEIHATDVSPAALEIAEANAARLQMESRVRFHDGDLLAGLDEKTFDFVVSNPPYVGESEEDSVQLEVRKFEPRSAVFGGPTGLEVISRLIPEASKALKPGGWLVMEISGTVAERVRELLAGWDSVEITRDLQGIERVIRAQNL